MLTKQKLPAPVIVDIFQKYDLGEIKKVEPLVTSGNIAYVIKSDSGKYLLRLSPFGPRWRSKEEIAAELELIDCLLTHNFPVPKPITMKNGKRIIFWKNHFGYLREFFEGEFKSNPTLKEIKKFGKLMGCFHNLVQNYETKNKKEHIWDLEETKKRFQQNKNIILKSNFKKKKEFVKRFDKEISLLNFPKDLPSGTVHEDLGKRHVLWQEDKITGLIDFDRYYHGRLVLDLGQACRGWCFVNGWTRWDKKNFQALIAGYQSKRKLTRIEKKYLVDSIKFGILERSLAFCLRFIGLTQDVEDQDFANRGLFNLVAIVEKNRKQIEKFLEIE